MNSCFVITLYKFFPVRVNIFIIFIIFTGHRKKLYIFYFFLPVIGRNFYKHIFLIIIRKKYIMFLLLLNRLVKLYLSNTACIYTFVKKKSSIWVVRIVTNYLGIGIGTSATSILNKWGFFSFIAFSNLQFNSSKDEMLSASIL